MLKSKLSTVFFTFILILILSVPAFAASTYLVDKQGDQEHPVVSGDIVVYEDHADGKPGIFMYDFSTEKTKRIGSTSSSQSAPHTDGDYVVWIDNSFDVQSINLYSIATEETTKLTSVGSEKRSPKVDYPWVVWSEYKDNSWDIYAYNISTKATKKVAKHNYNYLRKELDSDGNRRAHYDGQVGVTISGDKIVWTDFRNQKWDLYGADLNTGVEFSVIVGQRDQYSPFLEGERLVYQDNREFQSNIYLYDFKTEKSTLICGAAKDQEYPTISGNVIAWQDFRSQRWDIYGYDLNSGKEMVFSNKQYHQTYPSIDGNRLVFMDNSKSREDISTVNLTSELVVPTDLDSISGIKIIVNGRLLAADVSPIMENGRVLIPVRAVSEALGVNVDWKSDSQKIILSGRGKNVELTIGSKLATINGTSQDLDVPAMLTQGRTLVPLRFVSQAFGAAVNWDGNQQLVEISL